MQLMVHFIIYIYNLQEKLWYVGALKMEFGFETKDYFGRQSNIYKDIFKC